jgi:DNA-binding response OmpR family regulator
MRVLIIEDEYNLADVISESLKKNKYQVDIRTDGEEGYYDALTGIYDLIILDVMLPHMNGFDILKGLREQEIESKIIMLTAKGELNDKINGFSLGANDYLPKPFHIEELLARVNAQLKNPISIKKQNILEYGDLSLDIDKSIITCITNNESIELVCKEFQLLEYFIKNNEQILSREQIYDKVWGMENEIESNNLEAYLSFIRKKLKAIESKVNIKSCRGLGYRMEFNDEKTKK